MKQAVHELRKLKGIGKVLAKRFIEAGYDTPGKIAHASIEDLGKIPGVNPRMLPQVSTTCLWSMESTLTRLGISSTIFLAIVLRVEERELLATIWHLIMSRTISSRSA